jgi:hypothetical protein
MTNCVSLIYFDILISRAVPLSCVGGVALEPFE